jgi:MtaA/CmuA family methyltransferase
MAGILRGVQTLMLDLVSEPRRVHRLLEFCVKVACAYAGAMSQTGADAVQFGDSTASLISLSMYEEFVRPYQRPVIDAIRRSGACPFLHVCGNSNHLATLLAGSGAACVEIDSPADLVRTMAAFGDRAVVRGNVSTMLIKTGTAEQVEASARKCLEDAGKGRLLLSPGCGVPKGSPEDNIRALVAAARKWGLGAFCGNHRMLPG